MAAPSVDILKQHIINHIPDAQVEIHTYSGDDHFDMHVASVAFQGKSRVMQHKMVYDALGDLMREDVHALALKTKAV
ncbi:MAG: BolA family protein [Mariprofundaceae bacterium]